MEYISATDIATMQEILTPDLHDITSFTAGYLNHNETSSSILRMVAPKEVVECFPYFLRIEALFTTHRVPDTKRFYQQYLRRGADPILEKSSHDFILESLKDKLHAVDRLAYAFLDAHRDIINNAVALYNGDRLNWPLFHHVRLLVSQNYLFIWALGSDRFKVVGDQGAAGVPATGKEVIARNPWLRCINEVASVENTGAQRLTIMPSINTSERISRPPSTTAALKMPKDFFDRPLSFLRNNR